MLTRRLKLFILQILMRIIGFSNNMKAQLGGFLICRPRFVVGGVSSENWVATRHGGEYGTPCASRRPDGHTLMITAVPGHEHAFDERMTVISCRYASVVLQVMSSPLVLGLVLFVFGVVRGQIRSRLTRRNWRGRRAPRTNFVAVQRERYTLSWVILLAV
jgi:hypothetical protein